MLIAAMTNKTALLVLMIVLIVFLVLLTVLGIVFIVALRKRAPVVKVVMAPPVSVEPQQKPAPQQQAEETVESADDDADDEPEQAAEEDSVSDEEDEASDNEEGEDAVYVKEGQAKMRYDRSFTAKLIQLKDENKEWYSMLKNELLSYKKVRDRMSWKRETFRMGKMSVARFVIRGKTLCLMLAVEPAGYTGTKFTVEDVSNVASTADTPTLYRIKSARRAKYAKEMIAGLMKEIGVMKDETYHAQDFYMPYDGTVGLMQRGLVKRIVTNSSRVYEIREVDETDAQAKDESHAAEQEAAAAESKQ
ncbi:MAG: hypothetical protein HFE48_00960 [Clostridia bacterium]|nr:hypothetical protein [Clostridia bacterium]